MIRKPTARHTQLTRAERMSLLQAEWWDRRRRSPTAGRTRTRRRNCVNVENVIKMLAFAVDILELARKRRDGEVRVWEKRRLEGDVQLNRSTETSSPHTAERRPWS